MNKTDKKKIQDMLSKAIENYFLFRDRDDNPDKPCIRREAAARQGAVFNLADYLYRYGFITFEECCETWAKVDIRGEDDPTCTFENCGACQNGTCKYIIEEQERLSALLKRNQEG